MSGTPSTKANTRCRDLSLESSARSIDRDVDALSALANETRYRIVRLLDEHGEVCVCDIEASLDASQSAISHALAALNAADLVDRRKDGRWRYYRRTALARSIVAAIDATREEPDE